jgi:hypothetical protein
MCENGDLEGPYKCPNEVVEHTLLVYMHLETYYSRSFNVTTASTTSLFLPSPPLLLCLLLLPLLLPVLLLILLLILQVPRLRLLRKCYDPGFKMVYKKDKRWPA